MRSAPSHSDRQRPILITGGSGFIGCNLADALAARGETVVILDSLTRDGVKENAYWLKGRHGDRIDINVSDVRDSVTVEALTAKAKAVLHLAGQVAVTHSLEDPVQDFEVNARGALNVLEAVRRHNPGAPILFASTNKVYGRLLQDDEVVRGDGRYAPRHERLARGVAENAPLDLYSPYGCSKGAADQYVRDYARVFGLRTAVLRMSCIYGPRQFGTEDQGWIAHFLLQSIRGKTVTIYGDGRQVRDALHVADAVGAWLTVLDRIEDVSGRVFNLGGGPDNSLSLLELVELIKNLHGRRPNLEFDSWRPGDQPWYVSDIGAIGSALGWRPQIALREGLASLDQWLRARFGASSPSTWREEACA